MPEPPATGGHRACVLVGERDLARRFGLQRLLDLTHAPHLFARGLEFGLEVLCLGLEFGGRQRTVGGVQGFEVALDAVFDLLLALLHFARREVAVPRVDRLELADINGDNSLSEQLQLPAQFNEAPAHVADAFTVVPAEVGNRLEVRCQATG